MTSGGSADPVTLTPGKVRSGIDAAMQPGGTTAGVVPMSAKVINIAFEIVTGVNATLRRRDGKDRVESPKS